ncbi:unnamed protein product, partial [Prunus brigantina]
DQKLEKFKGIEIKRWQQKMFFYLTTMNLAHVAREEAPKSGENPMSKETMMTMEAWKQCDFLYINYILNRLDDTLYDIYSSYNYAKEVKELQILIHDLLAEGCSINEHFQVGAITEKLPPSWKDFKIYLKHKRREMSMEDLILRRRVPVMEAKANVIETSKPKFQKNEGKRRIMPIFMHQKVRISRKSKALARNPYRYLAYSVSKLSRHTSNPGHDHCEALIKVLRYLKYTQHYGLHYTKYPLVLEGYSDANWISDSTKTKSTSGYVFILGGVAVSWKSSKQTCIARSTMESEFVALDKAVEEAEWLRNFLEYIPMWPKPVIAICIHCEGSTSNSLKWCIQWKVKTYQAYA